MDSTRAKWIFGWMLLAAMSSAGCDAGLTPQAQQLLNSGKASYAAGKDVAAIRSMNEFLAANGRSSRADEAYYYRGLAKYRQKDIIGAQADFHQVLQKNSRQFKVPSQKALGDIAYERQDMGLAESMYRDALAGMDETKPPADEVRYRLGQTLQRLGRWQDADLHFSRVMYLFGDSESARRAGRLFHSTAWTVQMAAMKDKRAADALAQQYRTANQLETVVRPVPSDAGPLLAVQAGRFPTYDMAAAAMAKVRAVNPNAYVTVTK